MTLLSFSWRDQEHHPAVETADVVLDARHLPNPHYRFGQKTGRHASVQRWLREKAAFQNFLDEAESAAVKAQKKRPACTLAIGCHGGRHRSVAAVEALAARLGAKRKHLNL